MAASVTTNEIATALLRKVEHQPPPHAAPALADQSARVPVVVHDSNKRPRVASMGELESQSKKNNTASLTPGQCSSVAYGHKKWIHGTATSPLDSKRAETDAADDAGGNSSSSSSVLDRDISTDIAAIAAKNEQLQMSVASLKRSFSLREEETHQLLLGLGALSAVAHELAALQRDYQERSVKNAELVQESLVQIAKCSAQVDIIKSSRGITETHLHTFRQECAHEMNRLVSRLGALAESTCQAPSLFEANDKDDDGDSGGLYTVATSLGVKLQQVERSQDEVCDHRAQIIDDGSVKNAAERTQQETTDRIHVALAQLETLHTEMCRLKQTLVQDNQWFRRHLEDILLQQMAHVREVQENERERVHEEMDEIRSGMCGILRDIHRLKERTKYMVPSMARSAPELFGIAGKSSEDRRRSTPATSSVMPTPCSELNSMYDCVTSSQVGDSYAQASHPQSLKSSLSSPAGSDDENWRMFPAEDTFVAGRCAAQLGESPHYSSRSSSLSGHLSVYGEKHVIPNIKSTAEQFDQQLLEQHRLFWIGEGAG
ncbi:unnamed protein product [Hyaloperonospora brassicae]|uniref:Kinesin n=1 Tax=Hyaloperonospora brassicae TaxID=162125 RepID=A0AAV0U1P0_HYABA|nr:unnamed protein product [Hyaloperonospora brassicae]